MRNNDEVNIAIKALRKIDFKDKVSTIMTPDSAEEAVIIGTNNSIAYLALQLLEIIHAVSMMKNTEIDIDEDFINNEKVKCTNDIKYCFDELSDVWPVCMYIAKNKEHFQKVKEYFQNRGT